MRIWSLALALALGCCLGSRQAASAPWRDLINQAESLAAVGEADSANTLLDEAISSALNEYADSGTTVEVRLNREGITERHFFSSIAEAESLYSTAASIKESIAGGNDAGLAQILYDLAGIYLQQRKYSDAASLYERTSRITEVASGSRHPDFARALLGIAESERCLRKYDEAESLYIRSTAILEEVSGKDHPEVARSINGLAVLCYEMGRLAEAESLNTRALAIREGRLGPDHLDVTTSLINLGNVFEAQGKYAAAEPLYSRAIATREKVLGAEHLDVAAGLINLAIVYYRRGEYAQAEPLYKRAIAIREKALGSEHPEVAAVVSNLASLYLGQGRYSEAEQLSRRALAARQKALGPEHPLVAASLNNLANILKDQGRYPDAESLYRQALAIKEKAFGLEHPDVAVGLNNLAALCKAQGKYIEAEPLYLRALSIRENALGQEHPDVAASLNNLANLYRDQGRYPEAEALYKRALAIWERSLTPEHPYVLAALNNLAIVYFDQGNYPETESLYKRALAAQEKKLGPYHPDVARSLNNLARLYSVQGRYAEAKPIIRRAQEVFESAYGTGHPAFAQSLENLASICADQGNYAEAESLYSQALALREKSQGPRHPDVATNLEDTAHLCMARGEYTEAEPLYRRALAIREEVLGPEHEHVAASLNSLGILCRVQDRYAEAGPLHQRALAISEKTLGSGHPTVAEILESMSQYFRATGAAGEALQTARRALVIRQANFRDGSRVMSERDALIYSQFFRHSLDNYISCCKAAGWSDPGVAEDLAEMVWSGKGCVSDDMFERQMSLVEETDSATVALAESMRFARYQLSSLFVEGPGDNPEGYRDRLDSLGNLANRLEADLSRQSSSYRSRRERSDISLGRIASALPADAALVEYVRYNYIEPGSGDETPQYIALVVTGTAKPVIIELGEADQTDRIIDDYRGHMLRVSGANRLPTPVDCAEYQSISRNLFESVWAPLERHTSTSGMLFLAPDGALNLVSFAGLLDNQSRYIVERYPIHYLSAGRDLIRLKEDAGHSRGLLAIGDPDFNTSAAAPSSEARPPKEEEVHLACAATRNARPSCGKLYETNVSPLPGTRVEIERIASRWEESTDEPLVSCLGPDASEEAFKTMAHGKRVIHIATHGYFLEGECQPEIPGKGLEPEREFIGENPLLLSGLFLAGANLHGSGHDDPDTEDGILTAYEVSGMDLEGTQVVVLSACETGLGEVERGEGVYGLRRAFQVAGARTVISALWPVSDETTAEMMSQLYDRGKKPLPETIRKIQMKKIKELRREGKAGHPFAWAGFIALGDWR